jgi:hypothetical protein
VVVVASAGNDGTNSGFAPYIYPASFTGVIAVAAVDSSGRRASFSEQNAAVELAAPGVDVIGAGPNDEYIEGDGTSPAAALVSGVAALIRSRYPRLSPALVGQALMAGTVQRPSGGYSPATGFGEVDAVTALQTAARLAAARPAAVLAPAARFGGTQPPAPIPVTNRDAAGITGDYATATGGGLVAVAALALIPVLARRSRRAPLAASGQQPGPFAPFQPAGRVPQPTPYAQQPWPQPSFQPHQSPPYQPQPSPSFEPQPYQPPPYQPQPSQSFEPQPYHRQPSPSFQPQAYQPQPYQPQPYEPPTYPRQPWQPRHAWPGQPEPSPPEQPPYQQDLNQSYRPQPSFQPRRPYRPPWQPESSQEHYSSPQPNDPPNQQPPLSPGTQAPASNSRNDPDRPKSWFDPL